MKTKKANTLIREIEKTRSRNNKNWMDLLRLAIQYAPIKAKKVLKEINKNDQKISKLLKKISTL
tara:strand:+ start:124 stop:315 length:192 start_codon:yes stop_codon:yes gene_type:complete